MTSTHLNQILVGKINTFWRVPLIWQFLLAAIAISVTFTGTFPAAYGQSACMSTDWVQPLPTGENLQGAYVDSTKIILTGECGIILRSTNHGSSWQRIYVPFDSLIDDVTFTSLDTGFIVGRKNYSKGTIMKTTDAGLTWLEVMGDTAAGEMTSIHFPTPQIGYACGRWGKLHKTTDGGDTWFHLPWTISTQLLDVFFTSPDTGWIATTNLYKTVDGGMTWTYVSNTNSIGARTVAFYNNQEGVIGASNGYTSYTHDGGLSWNTVYTNTTVSFNDIVILDSVSYMMVGGTQLSISHNRGLSYTTNMLNPGPYGSVLYCGASYRNEVIVGGMLGYYAISTNTAVFFNPHISLPANSELHGICFPTPLKGYAVSALLGPALYTTTNGGSTWQVNNSFGGWSVHFASPDTGYVVGGTVSIHRTTNAGASWTALSHTWYNNDVQRVWFLTGTTGLIFSNQGGIKRTADMGVTWSLVQVPTTTNNAIMDVDFVDDNIGFAIGSSLFVTANGGINWISKPIPFPCHSVKFLTDSIGFIGGNSARVAKTTDGGTTWTTTLLPTNGSTVVTPVSAIEFFTPQVGVLTSGPTVGHFWLTTDGGNTWPTKVRASTKRFLEMKLVNSTQAIGVTGTSQMVRMTLGSAPPTLTGPISRCGSGPITLAATGEGMVRWYEDSSSISPIVVGDSLHLPMLTHTDTFFVENLQGLCPSVRVPYVVTVFPLPALAVGLDTMRCGQGPITLVGSSTGLCEWYSDTTQSAVATGSTFVPTVYPPGQTYYVANWDGYCRSAFTPVHATALTLPAPPQALGTASCGPVEVVLNASSNDSIHWFSSPLGGTVQQYGNSWFLGTVSQSTTVGVAAWDGSCLSAILPVQVTIFPVPGPTSSIDSTRCGPGTFTLIPQGGGIFHWYSDTLAAPIATSAVWTTPMLTQADTFWFGGWNGNCEGALAPITLQILPIPVVSPITGPTTTLNGQTWTYYSVPVGGVTYSWQVTNGVGNSTTDSIVVTWGNPGTASIGLTVTDTAGCSNSTVLNVLINNANSTPSGLLAQQLVIAPNPSSGTLGFQILGGWNVTRQVRLTNASGMVVYQSELPFDQGGKYAITLPSLASGVYFLTLDGVDGHLSGVWCIQK